MTAQVALVTNVGLRAALNAGQPGGVKFKIDHFKIGSASGFEPLSTDTDVHSLVYSGVSGQMTYRIDSPNRIVYRISLDATVGGFNVGNIGLYMDTGELFALAVLVDSSTKVSNALPNIVGNVKNYDILITFANADDLIDFTLSQTAPTDIPIVNTESGLPQPNAAPFKLYIVKQNSLYNNSPTLAYTDGATWTYMVIQEDPLNLYLENFSSGTPPFINSLALNSVAIGNGSRIEGSGQRSIALGLVNLEGNDNFIAQNGGNGSGQKNIGNNLVCIGSFNRAGTSSAHEFNIVIGGSNNLVQAIAGTIVGGKYNTIAADYATIVGGKYGLADILGQRVQSVGRFLVNGDAQRSEVILRGQTTNNSVTEILIDGTDHMVLHDRESWSFEVNVVARRTDTGSNESFAQRIRGLITRATGVATIAFVGNPIDERIAATRSAWKASVDVDILYGGLKVLVTGENGRNINWVAHVSFLQVKG